ncbi:hypothetical protein CTAM01_06521 [Colletotrichum tamarilloi]|uniref:Uncharacterized protein n=1 Tax=Colletotrichum tamarilloi TaxID=1209934 RepID=A0ABQ9RBJ7_9PEZI|nr:uncharacterized protein CTAM01_06521 [Colletotrichum tamarilloi]KAK1500586.1 hypothetical protein CTAM01_06521 [Colletotrichum tamarilloi]
MSEARYLSNDTYGQQKGHEPLPCPSVEHRPAERGRHQRYVQLYLAPHLLQKLQVPHHHISSTTSNCVRRLADFTLHEQPWQHISRAEEPDETASQGYPTGPAQPHSAFLSLFSLVRLPSSLSSGFAQPSVPLMMQDARLVPLSFPSLLVTLSLSRMLGGGCARLFMLI